jgi:hypothetical protein
VPYLRNLLVERRELGREPMPRWQLHDLRRTAKTLMARTGVRPDISERVLAHTIEGVEGVYDCFNYLPEKRDALDKLVALVDRVVKYKPPSSTADGGRRRQPATSRHRLRSDEPMSGTLRDVIERARRSVCGEYWIESLSRDDQHLIDEYGAGCRVYSLTGPGRFTWSKACETDFPRTSERGMALIRARNRYKALQSQYRAALYWLQFKGLLRRQGETPSSWQQGFAMSWSRRCIGRNSC